MVDSPELRAVVDEMRDALAGPERLRAVEHARQTISEAVGVELLAGNLKRGSATSAGAWLNRGMRSA